MAVSSDRPAPPGEGSAHHSCRRRGAWRRHHGLWSKANHCCRVSVEDMRQRSPRTTEGRHVGVVASYDFTRQEELRRWIPPNAQWTMTYTGEVPYRDNLELVSRLGRAGLLAGPVHELVERGAEAVAYLCTACSFVDGVIGERALREAMLAYGAQRVVTTSGAVSDALRAVGARRLAVVHPYQEPVDRLLATYLGTSGFDVVALTGLGLDAVEDVYAVEEQQVVDTVIREITRGPTPCSSAAPRFPPTTRFPASKNASANPLSARTKSPPGRCSERWANGRTALATGFSTELPDVSTTRLWPRLGAGKPPCAAARTARGARGCGSARLCLGWMCGRAQGVWCGLPLALVDRPLAQAVRTHSVALTGDPQETKRHCYRRRP